MAKINEKEFFLIEKKILKLGTLCFGEDYIHDTDISFKDWWLKFYDYNLKYQTYHVHTKEFRTSIKRHRSLIDIFLIARNYFKKIRLEEIIKVILEQDYCSHFCPDIKRLCMYPIAVRQREKDGIDTNTPEFNERCGRELFDYIGAKYKITGYITIPPLSDEQISILQQKMIDSKTLYLQDYTHNEELSLKEFYINSYTYVKSYKLLDTKTNNVTTSPRYRSLTDIYNLCYTYYKCSLLEFLKIVDTTNPVGDDASGSRGFLGIFPKEVEPSFGLYESGKKFAEYNMYTFTQLRQYSKQ